MHSTGTLFESAANFNTPTDLNRIFENARQSDSISQPLSRNQLIMEADGRSRSPLGKRDLNAP